MRLLYSLLMTLIVWTALVPWKLWCVARGRFGLRELRQCLGMEPVTALQPGAGVVIHAVSVGELAATEPLLRQLAAADRPLEVMLTVGNRDGLAVARRIAARHPVVKATSLLPWDRGRAVAAWLGRLRPALFVVVETEIWPNLFFACRRAGLPLCLASARIYPADEGRYALARGFFREVLSCATWIGVQSPAERERFLALGADPERTEVAGNLKLDARPAPEAALDARFGRLEGGGALIVAGSTHAPEEEWLVEALMSLRSAHPRARLLLAPRHVDRCASVATVAESAGLRVARWSSLEREGDDWDVLLLDEFGWLPVAYRFAALCVVGGSLVDQGGQNPLEPAAAGRAVVIGPHVRHFQDVVEELAGEEALVRLRSADELTATLRRLLDDERARAELGRRARAACEARRGVARRYADALLSAVDAPTKPS